MAYEYERFERANLYNKTRYDEKKTHAEMCIDYLEQYDSITPLEALTAFDCFRLAAVVCKLRKRGYAIAKKINENGKRYAIYYFEGVECDG